LDGDHAPDTGKPFPRPGAGQRHTGSGGEAGRGARGSGRHRFGGGGGRSGAVPDPGEAAGPGEKPPGPGAAGRGRRPGRQEAPAPGLRGEDQQGVHGHAPRDRGREAPGLGAGGADTGDDGGGRGAGRGRAPGRPRGRGGAPGGGSEALPSPVPVRRDRIQTGRGDRRQAGGAGRAPARHPGRLPKDLPGPQRPGGGAHGGRRLRRMLRQPADQADGRGARHGGADHLRGLRKDTGLEAGGRPGPGRRRWPRKLIFSGS